MAITKTLAGMLHRWSSGSAPLTRLNFFDGLFLRAEHLRREQDGHRNLVFSSNVAHGWGVSYGLDVDVEGDEMIVNPGLAVDVRGRVLLLTSPASAAIDDLTGSRADPYDFRLTMGERLGSGRFEVCDDVVAAPATTTAAGAELWVVTVRHAESAGGWEEVRGRTCEDACDASMERPYLVEHATIHLWPLRHEALPTSDAVTLGNAHLRSRVATAVFALEQTMAGALLSNQGFRTPMWCHGAPPAVGVYGDDVPLAVLARAGGSVLFLDEWIARRELIETSPRRYWEGRFRMRPFDVYLAQVLQFQCQLAEALGQRPPGGGGDDTDPCAEPTRLLAEAVSMLDLIGRGLVKTRVPIEYLAPSEVAREDVDVPSLADRVRMEDASGVEIATAAEPVEYPAAPPGRSERLTLPAGGDLTALFDAIGGVKRVDMIRRRLGDLTGPTRRRRQILVDWGFVTVPPFGYLPVDVGGRRPIESQVTDLMGPGVDLRFCSVRLDQVAGELESAQHLDRISLIAGIDRPAEREEVDILVPDGRRGAVSKPSGFLFDAEVVLATEQTDFSFSSLYRMASEENTQLPLRGAARLDAAPGGPFFAHVALVGGLGSQRAANNVAGWIRDFLLGVEINSRPGMANTGISSERVAAVAAEIAAHSTDATYSHRASEGDGEPIAVWASVTADRNPFDLGVDGSGNMQLEARSYSTVSPSHWIVVRATGRFGVLQDHGNEIEVAFAGYGSTTVDGSTSEGPFRHRFVLRLDGNTFSLRYPKREPDGSATFTWGGERETTGEFRAGANLPFFGAVTLKPTQQETGYFRDMAMSAVTILGGIANAGGFAEEAAAKLFPPVTTSSTTTLTGPHGWVAFKRRTRYDCALPEAPGPVVIRDAVVSTWYLAADNENDAAMYWKMLRDGSWDDVNNRATFRRVASTANPARFAGTTAELRITPVDLRLAWQSSGAGPRVMFAGYAPPGAVVQPIGRERMGVMLDALPPVASFDGDHDFGVGPLPAPPSTMLDPGADAVGVFITLGEKVKLCAELFSVNVDGYGRHWEKNIRPGVRDGVELDSGGVTAVGVATATEAGFDTEGLPNELSGFEHVRVVVWLDPSWANEQGSGIEKQVREFVAGAVTSAGIPISDVEIELVPVTLDRKCPIWAFVNAYNEQQWVMPDYMRVRDVLRRRDG